MDDAETRPPRLLLIEDDDELAALLAEYLGQRGFALTRVAWGTEGIAQILVDPPDIVVLDLMLPGANGLDVCRAVRHRYRGAILMLTASQSEVDHVVGLELGADDFVIKPIEPRVLLARIRTQLRRLSAGKRGEREPVLLRVGSLEVDVLARDVRVGGRAIPLTTMEFDVLYRLTRDAGTVVERDALYTDVMRVEYDGIDRGMDVHVSRIRRKLQDAGFDASLLKSVRGIGYLLAVRG